MNDFEFFALAGAPTVEDIVEWTGAQAPDGANLSASIQGVAPLESGGVGDLVFLDNPKYAFALLETRATACLTTQRFADKVAHNTIPLISKDPYRAFAMALAHLYPQAMRPASAFGSTSVSSHAVVHPEATLNVGVVVDPGAVIGPLAVIGAGTIVGANSVIGPGVRIGRDCSIGAHATVQHALVGDRVIVHPGVRIGQDGFGFAMGPKGHLKVPQVGRVIIQNDVEIGANSTIDRGANRDTIIGEGTKIDNLVQIGHNVVIGRHCVIVSQVGISGSTELGDFVACGGQAGLTGHLKIGTGAQIAAQSGVMTDVPAGIRWGGSPGMPMKDYLRRVVTLDKLASAGNPKAMVGPGDVSTPPEK
jgi:UDP-3-O-[3-hydroxymyristoyl] glucosamine N-acyltransferase